MTVPPEAYYEHVDLIGRTVDVRTVGALSLTGELRPPQHGHHVVEVGGVGILVPTDSTRNISLSLPNRGLGRASDGTGHILDDVIDQIDPAHWAEATDHAGAAAAVLGEIVGRPVSEIVTAPSGTRKIGSQTRFTGDGIDYQAVCVYLVGQPIAFVQRIAHHGYSELTQAAIDELTGSYNRDQVQTFLQDGFVVWQSQARRDAEQLLAEPAVQAAIGRVAEAIPVHGRLEGDQVRELIGDPASLTTHRVWLPDYPELERIREQIRSDQDDETDQA